MASEDRCQHLPILLIRNQLLQIAKHKKMTEVCRTSPEG